MNFIKTNLEIIIGFAALIISFGTFKEELASVKLDLMYMHLTLAQYLLGIIVGFTICIWLNVMVSVVSGTTAGKSKLFDHFQPFAHKLFMAILYSPFVLIVNLILNYGDHTELNDSVHSIFMGIAHTLLAGAIVRALVNIFIHESSDSKN